MDLAQQGSLCSSEEADKSGVIEVLLNCEATGLYSVKTPPISQKGKVGEEGYFEKQRTLGTNDESHQLHAQGSPKLIYSSTKENELRQNNVSNLK